MPRSDAPGRVPPPNRLLAALPPREYDRLRPHLEPAPLTTRAILYEPGQPVRHVYFPGSGVLSLLGVLPDGDSIEVGVVGREGMAGLSVFLGVESGPTRCLVQVPGEALRMAADAFRSRVGRGSRLHGLLLRYTHGLLAQVAQSAACNALHPVEQRMCRWLLMVHSRAGSDRFPLTHDFLAAMLGVRRASVTEAARELRQAGLIRYGQGQLTVLDRPGLEVAACACYRTDQAGFG
jgi:CRP-like cAMP-binding protein